MLPSSAWLQGAGAKIDTGLSLRLCQSSSFPDAAPALPAWLRRLSSQPAARRSASTHGSLGAGLLCVWHGARQTRRARGGGVSACEARVLLCRFAASHPSSDQFGWTAECSSQALGAGPYLASYLLMLMQAAERCVCVWQWQAPRWTCCGQSFSSF